MLNSFAAAAVLFTLSISAQAKAAAEPMWIEPPASHVGPGPAAFIGRLTIEQPFDRALVRLVAYDRFRLFLNGTGVSLGDTPWDALTYDVTKLLRSGVNEVRVEVAADAVRMPENGWIGLERRLSVPGSLERIRFRTADARHDEWVYVELTDADGNSSGYFCPERGHHDLVLGHDGQPREHAIDVRRDKRLELQANVPFDFSRVAKVCLRVDQKRTSKAARGTVRFAEVALEGPGGAPLKTAPGWRVKPGSGEHRRSRVESVAGGMVLRYDFTPWTPIRMALELRVWNGDKEVATLRSGRELSVAGQPVVPVTSRPRDTWMWTTVALRGPDAAPRRLTRAKATLQFPGGVDRWTANTPIQALVQVRTCSPDGVERVQVDAENWQRQRVFSARVEVTCRDGVGEAALGVPALPRGVYRFRTDVGQPVGMPGRFTALAVLGPGEKRVSDVFDTLNPIGVLPGPGLQGVDLPYSDSPALLLGIRDLGVNFLQVHVNPRQLDNGEFDELLRFCRATGLRFAVNNESSNYGANGEGGRFDAPAGCHRWDLAPEALRKAAATGLFEGVVYDEGEHMQLCRNFYARLPDKNHRKPYLVETTGMSLTQAYDAFLAAARTVREYNGQHGTAPGSHGRMLVESVFPALWHPLARAGVTLCPKLLKEDIHPVVLALALGAAKQYGAELWFTPDLWYLGQFPGHPVEEYAAALRLAHAAGVDNLYSEYIYAFCRMQGAVYDLTAYAEAMREFMLRWRPAHARGYTYRDYEPEVALIRFPDGDWGQASCYYWNTLYGAENLQSTPETREWFQVWHLLTAGATHPEAVNANSTPAYPVGTLRFQYPCAPTAVYDHLVGPGPLAGVGTIFLCGITVSENTLRAVQDRVRGGATCFAPPRLCPADIRAAAASLPARIADGKGAWIVVSGFRPEDLGPHRALIPQAGPAMRLKFRGQTVAVGDPQRAQ
jgi:hypothetical protein